MRLREVQDGLIAAVAGNADAPAVVERDGIDRIGVYRNNLRESLQRVLDDQYPAVAALVGESFMRAMGRGYIALNRPQTGCVTWYGADFADFIAGYGPAAGLAYLADVARFERAWHEAYHAADDEPLDPAGLAAAGEAALRASVQIVESRWPVAAIRHFALGGGDALAMESGGGVWLVHRPGLAVETREIGPGMGGFLAALRDGAGLAEAAGDAGVDVLAGWLRDGLAWGVFRHRPGGPEDRQCVFRRVDA